MHVFAGKAAPGYARAKLIIKFIHSVAEVVNGDRARQPLAARGVPARLPRHAGGDDHAGRRSVGADLDGGHGGVGHRQHEVRAERRADDRHARRRQHRDRGRPSAPRTCSSSDSASRTCSGSSPTAATGLASCTSTTRASAASWTRSPPACWPRANRACSIRSATPCSPTTSATSISPISIAYADAHQRAAALWIEPPRLGAQGAAHHLAHGRVLVGPDRGGIRGRDLGNQPSLESRGTVTR